MATTEQLLFELQRRVILFKSSTTMPDNTQLGFNADPNTASSSGTDGEKLIYGCPIGTRYQQDDGTQWYKKTAPNIWETFGAGSADTIFDETTYATEETVGGIQPGRTFDQQQLVNVMLDIFYPDPDFVNPDHAIAHDVDALQVIGAVIPTVNVTLRFDRGEISPAYATDGYRAGMPTTFTFFRNSVQTDVPALGDLEKTLVASSVTVVSGINKWEGRVSYAQGNQPMDVKEEPFDSPFPSGTTALKTASFTGVYPVFATTDSITTLTQLPLQLMDDPYIEIHLASETLSDKQTVWIPQVWDLVIGVRQLLFAGKWEWLGGTKDESLAFFDITSDIQIIEGEVVSYFKYEHNGALTGSRILRFWTIEPPIEENPEDPGNPVTYSESITHSIIF